MMLSLAAPSSKSLSHRYLMAAALALGETCVYRVLESEDIRRTAQVVRGAGARIAQEGNTYRVAGVGGRLRGAQPGQEALSCDMHESGTTCRLLTALLAAGEGTFRIHGAPRMHERPIGTLTTVLEQLGARIRFEERQGFPPFLLESSGLRGGTAEISLEESSQYLSGLLLAAPLMREGLVLTVVGKKALSWPYVGLTLQTMQDFGIAFRVECLEKGLWNAVDWRELHEIRPGELRFRVFPGTYRAGEYTVEGDWSGASYFLAAGAVGRSPLHITGLNTASLQGDRVMLDILRRMGAVVEMCADGVSVSPAALHGVELDMGDCPDLVPTVAAVAAHARGTTRIRNVAHLRIKECDRIAAPVAELRRAGIRAEELPDGLVIEGGCPQIRSGTVFQTYNDHRIAMSLAVLALGSKASLTVDNPGVVSKSFPRFWEEWKKVEQCQANA